MKLRHWMVGGIITLTLCSLIVALTLFVKDPVVMQPSGLIGSQQRDLFLFAIIVMLTVVIPVFGLLLFIAWKYRATNKKSKYSPKWSNNKKLEAIWWGIPIVIVGLLSFVTWQTSHSLDPYRSIESANDTIKVQVVALQWKWLFIYPEQSAASVNELLIPVSTPIEFTIASDAPMNSFWIPELGGQIYAMNGMASKLHLVADKTGEFKGISSNISGEGFADMKFVVKSQNKSEFDDSIKQVSSSGSVLSIKSYDQLARPSIENSPKYYHLEDKRLFQAIIDKYMMPKKSTSAPDHNSNHGTSY